MKSLDGLRFSTLSLRLLSVAIPGLLAFALVACACGQQFEPVPEDQVDAAQRALAEKVGDQVLKQWAAGTFEPLSDAFTSQMKSALPPAKSQSAYKQMKGLFGDYQSMEYAETHRSKSGQKLTIYRFRGSFSETSDRPEVRIVLDGSGKVAGFWVKPWLKVLN